MSRGPAILDDLDDARVKLRRANKHIKTASVLIHNYVFSKPYEIVIEHDAAAKKKTARFWSRSRIPDEADEAVESVVQNLRSALDYIAHAAVLKRGPPPVPFEKIAFPIFKNRAAFTDPGTQGYIRKIGGVEWLNFLAAQKPYGGGDDVLFALNAANNVEKHRHLARIGGTAGGGGRFKAFGPHIRFNVGMLIGSLDDGMELVSVNDTASDPEVKLAVFIALRGAPGFERTPAEKALLTFYHRVEAVLTDARRAFFPAIIAAHSVALVLWQVYNCQSS